MAHRLLIAAALLALASAQYYLAYDTYVPGRQYENGDRVRVGKQVLECRRPPHNRFCHMDTFKPTGPQWSKAWKKVQEVLIQAENKDFNLPEYTRYDAYKQDELVQFRGHVYKCL